MGRVEFLPYAESVELIRTASLTPPCSPGLGMAAIRDPPAPCR